MLVVFRASHSAVGISVDRERASISSQYSISQAKLHGCRIRKVSGKLEEVKPKASSSVSHWEPRGQTKQSIPPPSLVFKVK
uniref:Uncharacterized protein n=1 Tax=Physcomitrium patens TaxID=3218 RepID=A0A7I4CPX7_PHYPA